MFMKNRPMTAIRIAPLDRWKPRRARTHDAQIYPSHEMAPFQTWKKAPTYYEG
jgi:hypothetical protein